MIVFHGTTFYGKVDHVKGLFHVATLFFHVNWIPIIPRQSYLMLEGAAARNGPAAIPIGLSGKSILFAWMRFLAVVGGCIVVPVACIVVAAENQGPAEQVFIGTALAAPIVSLLLFAVSYRFAGARPERALELARLGGIEPATVGRFFAEHLTPEEEDRLRNLIAEQVDSPNSP